MTARWSAGDALPPIALPLTRRRSVQAVAGTRDYYPVHHDEAAAQANGARTIFFNTMFFQAFVGRAACAWFGNDAFLRRLEVAMVGSAYVGTTLTADGVVIALREDGGTRYADAEVTLATEDGVAARARFTVQLPPA